LPPFQLLVQTTCSNCEKVIWWLAKHSFKKKWSWALPLVAVLVLAETGLYTAAYL